jgi:hypothetical protein
MGELGCEGKDESGVDARCGEEFKFFGEWCDEWKGDVWTEKPDGVRIEGKGEGASVEVTRAADDLVDDELVAAVHSVEVADGSDGRAEVAGEF